MADGLAAAIEGGHYYIIGLLVAAFIMCSTLLIPIFISIAEVLGMPPNWACFNY